MSSKKTSHFDLKNYRKTAESPPQINKQEMFEKDSASNVPK